MPPVAKRLGLRLFIEGIEVPVIGATVSASPMSPGVANIQVPFSDEMTELLPRSVVHLFSYDPRNPVAEQTRKQQNSVVPEFTFGEGQSYLDPSRWHLLFVGELMGFQYAKSESGRNGILMCSDFTSYWDACKIYYGNKTLGNKHFKQAIFMGAAQLQRGKRKLKGANTILKILRSRPSTIPKLQGLLGGVVHLLESITGVYDKRAKKRFRGATDFFSQAELRLKLTKQLGASPNDLSSRYLTGGKQFRKLIRRISRQFRGTSSYAQLVGALLQQVHHAHYPVLAPPYRPAGTKVKALQLVRVGTGSKLKKATDGINSQLDEVQEFLEGRLDVRRDEVSSRALADPYKYTLTKKSVLTDDTDAIASWSSGTRTRLPSSTETINRVIDQITAQEGNPEQLKNNKKSLRQLNIRANALKRAVAIFDNNLTGEVTVGAGGNDGTPTATYPRHDLPNVLAARRELLKAELARKRARGGPRYKAVNREIELSDRLVTTLLCPELWMVPPPRCNVIFPEQYSNYQFGRQFMSEVTRLWMHGLRRNGRANLSRLYFAPNVDVINGQVGRKTAGKAASQSISFLMPHEKFTGIIPSMRGLGNLEALRKLNKKVEKKEGSPSVTSWRTKDPALARASNYHFFRDRFQNRTLSGTGPYNPGLVVGLPAMLLDPRVTNDTLTSGKTVVKGKHFLGLLSGVKHVVSQRGGQTSFQMSFVRVHDEGLNIFGEVKEGKVSVKRKTRTGGSRIRVQPGTEVVAEVYGFTQKKVKRKAKTKDKGFPDYYYVSRLVPIIGMLGTRGRSGKHITAGLTLQPNIVGIKSQTARKTANGTIIGSEGGNFSGTDLIPGTDSKADPGFTKFDRTLAQTELPLNNQTLIQGDLNEVQVQDFVHTHRVTPKKFKTPERAEGELSVAVPTRITSTRIIDGYKYKPKKPWMSSRAIGSVVVDAYQMGGTPPKTKQRDFEFSFEQIARPPWLADIYLNQNIGNQFYNDLFGCKALTDITLVTEAPAPDGAEGAAIDLGLPDTTPIRPDRNYSDVNTLPSTQKAIRQISDISEIILELKEGPEVEDRTNVVISTSEGDTFEVPAKVIGGVPIQVAAEQLAETYAVLKASRDTDIWTFIDTYTARRFATIEEIFGFGFKPGDNKDTPAKTAGVIGTVHVQPQSPFDQSDMFLRQDNAQDGFHSYAFGDFKPMAAIDHEPLADVTNQGKKKIEKFVDPRKERYASAVAYRNSLLGVIGEKS